MCRHPPHQMCTNCAPLHKGDKVKLQMLCQHGPEAKCTNCLAGDKVRLHLACVLVCPCSACMRVWGARRCFCNV